MICSKTKAPLLTATRLVMFAIEKPAPSISLSLLKKKKKWKEVAERFAITVCLTARVNCCTYQRSNNYFAIFCCCSHILLFQCPRISKRIAKSIAQVQFTELQELGFGGPLPVCVSVSVSWDSIGSVLPKLILKAMPEM